MICIVVFLGDVQDPTLKEKFKALLKAVREFFFGSGDTADAIVTTGLSAEDIANVEANGIRGRLPDSSETTDTESTDTEQSKTADAKVDLTAWGSKDIAGVEQRNAINLPELATFDTVQSNGQTGVAETECRRRNRRMLRALCNINGETEIAGSISTGGGIETIAALGDISTGRIEMGSSSGTAEAVEVI